MGLMRNFSCGGLNLVSYDSSFMPQEGLELNLRFPHSDQFVPVLGNVVWEKQTGNKYVAGIKLEIMDKEIQNQIMEKISSYGNIPVKNILYGKNTDYVIKEETEVKSVSKSLKQKRKTPEKSEKSSIIKQYLKDGSRCKVTFRLPKDAAPDARNVTVVGDFNQWDITKTAMTRLKNGDFLVTLVLPSRKEYKFRYLIDGNRWENDWCADKYVSNTYGTDDSVVIV
jgi:hypothetical protein